MTIIFRIIRTPDKANKFGRSAGVRLNEVLLYHFKSGLPIPSNRENLSIIEFRIDWIIDWIAQDFHRLDNYRRTFIDYRYLSIFLMS